MEKNKVIAKFPICSCSVGHWRCFNSKRKYLILRGGRRERSYTYNPLTEETVWSNNEMRVICSDKSELSWAELLSLVSPSPTIWQNRNNSEHPELNTDLKTSFINILLLSLTNIFMCIQRLFSNGQIVKSQSLTNVENLQIQVKHQILNTNACH